MLLYALTVLLSSFLLFQIQPMIAKLILPWFGGSAAVWTTCMLFFQAALLLGYLYSHWSVTRLSPRAQLLLHLALLALCVLVLPVTPSEAWKPTGGENPTIRIFGLLAATVGLPYFLLSTTGPLIQAWYTRAFHGAAPYRLFALSNLGSALALLTYPVVVEPFLTARAQTWIWSGVFIAFAVFCGMTAWFTHSRGWKPAPKPDPSLAAGEAKRPSVVTALTWVLLAACASVLLLAVTNFLCQDVAPVPFLWILPLTLYLLTFILCFDADGWYRRNIFLALLPLALGSMAYFLWDEATRPKLWPGIGLYASGFFVCCMVCHGELARMKPHPRHLTGYFLMIATGGALGGLFVGVFAPYFFRGSFELHVALVLCAALAVVRLFQDPPLAPARFPRILPELGAGLAFGLLLFLVIVVRDDMADCRLMTRNFYGTLRVRDRLAGGQTYRALLHGVISHGEQWLDADLRRDPVTYYCRETGVGQALTRKPGDPPQRVGIIGLGAGTLAAYGRPGDVFRFYELNPLVIDVAKQWFNYLGDSQANIDIALGDARLSLEREPKQNFDLLAIDAFASDSIPVHLLTREAFGLYFRHLKPHGVLAVHASNKYLDLKPLLERLAASFGKRASVVDTEDDDDGVCYGTTWVLISADGSDLAPKNGHVLQASARRLWTDDYSNLYQLLK